MVDVVSLFTRRYVPHIHKAQNSRYNIWSIAHSPKGQSLGVSVARSPSKEMHA